MKDNDLKTYQSGRGGGSGNVQNWYIGDKQGRVYYARTHPTDHFRYVFYLDEGKRQMLGFEMSGQDIRLLRDLLNSMPEDDKL